MTNRMAMLGAIMAVAAMGLAAEPPRPDRNYRPPKEEPPKPVNNPQGSKWRKRKKRGKLLFHP